MLFDLYAATRSVYIHWPFCPYKCYFCPFVALAGHDQFMERYHAALKQEIISYFDKRKNPVALDTVFIGGGTPSTYPEHLLLDMFDTLNKRVDFSENKEISIEVNPGTVTMQKLAIWKEAGVNRLSIGVQSLNDKVLKGLNRHQSAMQVTYLLEKAQSYFNNLSIDLIIGLPEVTEEQWKEYMRAIMLWPITHISIYFLTVHEETPLYFGVKKNKIILPPDDNVVDLYHWSVALLEQHNFKQYEISNFARPGYESRHNSAYWQRKPYKGFGLGAASFDGHSRFQNDKRLLEYLEAVEQGAEVTVMSEMLTEEQVWLEKLMLGLRQAAGITLSEITDPLNEFQKSRFFDGLDQLKDAKLLEYNNSSNSARLTAAGLAVANEITVKLSVL